jgi:hypothetical protein
MIVPEKREIFYVASHLISPSFQHKDVVVISFFTLFTNTSMYKCVIYQFQTKKLKKVSKKSTSL